MSRVCFWVSALVFVFLFGSLSIVLLSVQPSPSLLLRMQFLVDTGLCNYRDRILCADQTLLSIADFRSHAALMQCRGCGSGWQHSAQGASSSHLCGPNVFASGQSSGRAKVPRPNERTWRQILLKRQIAKRFSASKGLQRVDFLSRRTPGSPAKVLQTSSEGPSREPCEVLAEEICQLVAMRGRENFS